MPTSAAPAEGSHTAVRYRRRPDIAVARSPCQNQKSRWSLYGRLSGEKRVSRLIRKIDPSTRGSARIPGASRSSAGPRAVTSSFAGAATSRW